ncbi:MAG: hypothetical protein IH934_06510 [Nanoarchaeota archaeon]|nr:hypothetical protein [Nanoarchaeota archaeon]
MDIRLENIIRRIVAQGMQPPREMLDVVSRPNTNVTVLFTDTLSKNPDIVIEPLRQGDFSLRLMDTYGYGEEESVQEEYFHARLVNAFMSLPTELKEVLGEEWAEHTAQMPERVGSIDEYFKALVKAQVVYGIKTIYQRTTHEENRALETLRVLGKFAENGILYDFLEGNFTEFYNGYAQSLSALFANYSISVRSLKRTIDELPELAGRRFMGPHEEDTNILLPVHYDNLFAKDDLLKSGNDKVRLEYDPNSLLSLTHRIVFMSLLRENGVDPEGVTNRDTFYEFHDRKAKPIYQTVPEGIINGAFAVVLRSMSALGEFAEGYDLDVMCSSVATQFNVDDIARLTESAKTGNAFENIGNLAARNGYTYPHNKEEASAFVSEIKQSFA